jgi:hypothetical protein
VAIKNFKIRFLRYAAADSTLLAELTAAEAKVLFAMVAYCGSDDGLCYASYPTLEKATGMNRRTLERNLAKLEKRGVFTITGQRRGRGRVLKERQLVVPGKPVTDDGFSDTKPDTNDAKNPTDLTIKPDNFGAHIENRMREPEVKPEERRAAPAPPPPGPDTEPALLGQAIAKVREVWQQVRDGEFGDVEGDDIEQVEKMLRFAKGDLADLAGHVRTYFSKTEPFLVKAGWPLKTLVRQWRSNDPKATFDDPDDDPPYVATITPEMEEAMVEMEVSRNRGPDPIQPTSALATAPPVAPVDDLDASTEPEAHTEDDW